MAESARLRDRLSAFPIWWLLGVIVLAGAVGPYYSQLEPFTVSGQIQFILGLWPWLLDRPLRLLATIVAVPFVLPTKPY